MKNLKNTLTTIALLVTVQFGYAQSMKAPVSYKLKNGMTIIVAENSGTQKVFSTLSFEGNNQYKPENATVEELVKTILTVQLPELNKGLSFTEKGVNLATTADEFESAMNAMYTYVSAPDFSEEALNMAKSEVINHLAARDKYYPETITVDAINKLNVNELKAYYRIMANPATAYLTVVGNINASDMKSYARKELGQVKTNDEQSKAYLVSIL